MGPFELFFIVGLILVITVACFILSTMMKTRREPTPTHSMPLSELRQEIVQIVLESTVPLRDTIVQLEDRIDALESRLSARDEGHLLDSQRQVSSQGLDEIDDD